MPDSAWIDVCRSRLALALPAFALMPAALLAHGAMAQDDWGPIGTDRPTDAASPLLVHPGAFQLESGYKVTELDAPGGTEYSHLAPDLLMRYGVSERVEVRAYVPGWVEETGGGASGFSDVSVGAKIHLADEEGLRPQSALIIEASVPWGSDDVTADETIPKVLFLGSHTLNDVWSVTYNVGPSFVTSRINGQREEYVDWNYAVGAAASVGNGLALFAEVFGAAVDDNGGEDRQNLQVGATWLLTDQLQVDARVGRGLVSNEPDWFAGFGVSLRLPR